MHPKRYFINNQQMNFGVFFFFNCFRKSYLLKYFSLFLFLKLVYYLRILYILIKMNFFLIKFNILASINPYYFLIFIYYRYKVIIKYKNYHKYSILFYYFDLILLQFFSHLKFYLINRLSMNH